ncbi:MAG: 3-methyl-2-oxobutanoate hydroxymethyltransferase, partial [Nitrososphaerales archaeon]
KRKDEKTKISVVTCYDYSTALLAEKADIDILLVGDSGGMVSLGYDNTIPVTMNEMLMMARAVSRGASRPLLVGDMPFMSFNVSKEQAIRNAGKFVKEGGMDAVKIEGGSKYADTVRAISDAGIPVMGHIGLTPQTSPLWNGYKLQGTTSTSGRDLLRDAKSLGDAGAFSIVLEMVTEQVAELIGKTVNIPTIGIGSGPSCDGQVLVLHDILGLYDKFVPKFAKRYANLGAEILDALKNYRAEVLDGKFPTVQHTSRMAPGEFRKLRSLLSKKA